MFFCDGQRVAPKAAKVKRDVRAPRQSGAPPCFNHEPHKHHEQSNGPCAMGALPETSRAFVRFVPFVVHFIGPSAKAA